MAEVLAYHGHRGDVHIRSPSAALSIFSQLGWPHCTGCTVLVALYKGFSFYSTWATVKVGRVAEGAWASPCP